MTSLVKEAIRKKLKKECDKGKTENNTRRTRKNYLQNKGGSKMEIKGTKHKEKVTDYSQACKSCHRLFYFTRDCNGKTVVCPHCGAKH